MQRIIVLLIIAALGWYGYTKYQSALNVRPIVGTEERPSPEPRAAPLPKTEGPNTPAFKCDGRTYCSQMTSCAEATFFLKNCPGTKMDGNNDGIPCEKQWCK
jgi:hypothetical protein